MYFISIAMRNVNSALKFHENSENKSVICFLLCFRQLKEKSKQENRIKCTHFYSIYPLTSEIQFSFHEFTGFRKSYLS